MHNETLYTKTYTGMYIICINIHTFHSTRNKLCTDKVVVLTGALTLHVSVWQRIIHTRQAVQKRSIEQFYKTYVIKRTVHL